MINRNDYFYKGYDIDSKSKLEKKQFEFMNPFGYNFESNKKRVNQSVFDYKTNQDQIYPIIEKKK